MPLVSIIIPVYNVEKYLDKCIESVTNQTLEDIEIILINDGSGDNSPKLCDKWAKKDSRVKVIHQENCGVSVARNIGIKIATSKYIAFIDSDDYISNKYIEKLFNEAQDSFADVVVCNFNRVTEKGDVLNTDQCRVSKGVFNGIEICEMFSSIPVTFISPCFKLYKKDLFIDVKYPIGKINEDEAVAHRLIFPCEKVVIVEDVLYFYVNHDNSKNISSNINEYNFTDSIDAFYDRLLYFTEKNDNLRKLAEKEYLYTIFIQVGRLKTYSKVAKGKIETTKKQLNNIYESIKKNDLLTLQHRIVLYSIKYMPISTRVIARIWYKFIFGGR